MWKRLFYQKGKYDMRNTKELPKDAICLCNSRKKYGDCCKKKRFKYVTDGTSILREISMNQEVQDILGEQEKHFFEYYGRKPGGDKLVFSFMPIYNDEIVLKTIYAFRQLGIDERKIYAYL